ncbi:MAG TPA: hypothetical protein VJX68_07550 [Candidatus Binatus sp.]|uniref:hypothetical protein n=1 Tax=Candidatus Binatus sp. TaxID=2811406 RepID=UPI002B461BE3|nr:hypothetical protein [Candidatus Binatus sp.]HKN13037.1 hypothetical protein [Candidatus Binatus sp.]
MLRDHESKTGAPDYSPPSTHVEPPKIYLAACGALCDIFWWARRDPACEEQAPLPVKNETP